MAVEDPDLAPNDPGRRVDDDLPRKMPNDSNVVVSEDDLRVQPLPKDLREEIEHHAAEAERRADDGVLHVPRDEDALRARGACDRDKLGSQPVGRRFGRSERAFGAAPEAQVHVGDDDRPWDGTRRRLYHQRRRIWHRPKRAFHTFASRNVGKTILRRAENFFPRVPTVCIYI